MKSLDYRILGSILSVLIIFLVTACAGKPVNIDLPENHPANPQARETAFIPPPNPFHGPKQMETGRSSPTPQTKKAHSHQHQTTDQMDQMGTGSMPAPKSDMEMDEHQHQEHKK